mgnify:FL=1
MYYWSDRFSWSGGKPMLKKDIIELCLLHILSKEDLYGYEILRRIHECFPNTQESGIYALLRGLCKDGYTKQYEGHISDGPKRKYYHITKAGQMKYKILLDEWYHLRDTLATMGLK